jgi:hypothetical protein
VNEAVVVTEDEDEVPELLAAVVSELVTVSVELAEVTDDVVLAVTVATVDSVWDTVGDPVVAADDFEVVVRVDVAPSDVWTAVVAALVDDSDVEPVLGPPPDGRSAIQITPTNRAMKRTAAMGIRVVLPSFSYHSTA